MNLRELEIYQQVARRELTVEEAMNRLAAVLGESAAAGQPVTATYPLSASQKAVWIISRLAPDNYAYNLPFVFRIREPIEAGAFQTALRILVDRHPSLRTTFGMENDTPVQTVHSEGTVCFDQQFMAEPAPPELHSMVLGEVRKAFDLEKGPLFRVTLFTFAADSHILVLNFHHMVFDGVSFLVWIKELQTVYAAIKNQQTFQLPEIPVGYGDFVNWQNQMLQGAEGQNHRQYWLNQIVGELAPLELNYDKPRPVVPSYRGASYVTEIGTPSISELNEFALQWQIPLSVVMLGVFKLLLSRYTGQEDILVGMPVMARPGYQYENVCGYFANVAIIRSQLAGETPFVTLLQKISETVLNAIDHGDYPFFSLMEDLGKHNAQLFQVSFHFQNWVKHVQKDREQIRDLAAMEPLYQYHQEGEFDFTLEIIEQQDKMVLFFKYNPDLFEPETIQRMAEHYLRLAMAAIKQPSQCISAISMMGEAEKHRILYEWNETQCDYPPDCMHQLFDKQAARAPDAVAVLFEDQAMTYRELRVKSTNMAIYLKEQGVSLGSFVGVFMERSLEMMVALLGILKAGAAYVPMDPIYPSDRLAYMLEDTGAPVIITHSTLEAVMPPHSARIIRIDRDWAGYYEKCVKQSKGTYAPEFSGGATHDHLAYVIYTSGSTGRPKGVRIRHRGLANLLNFMAKSPGFTAQDHIIALASISFDMGIPELYLPLITGGKTELIATHVAKDGLKLKQKLEQSKATIIPATPATWQMLFAAEWQNRNGAKIFTGGEALSQELAVKLLKQTSEVWNQFGPTETTVWSTMERVVPGEKVNVGRPIANTQIYVLDKHLNPVPAGVPGELYIGGHGLAEGYNNQPETNKVKFIDDPFSGVQGAKIYRTGDLVRFMPDGRLEYIDRIDQQVKVRGFRIELGEIESALQKISDVRETVVVVRQDNTGGKSIVAFIVLQNSVPLLGKAERIELLKKWLPDQMIPSKFIFLESMPLNMSLKVDRKTLATKNLSEINERYGFKGDQTAESQEIDTPKKAAKRTQRVNTPEAAMAQWIESDVVRLISGILAINPEDIDPGINIGEFGFDSVRFVTLSVKIQQQYQIEISPALFFEYSTIESIAKYLLKTHPGIMKAYYQKELESLSRNPQGGKAPLEFSRNQPAGGAGFPESSSVTGGVIPIAIIGISGRLPQAVDLDEFWEHLEKGRDLVTEIPEERWATEGFYGDQPDQSNSKWAGFIQDFDKFDAAFFNISRREAELMDPHQRLFLEMVWTAIEDAGYKVSDLSDSRTGVFAGVTSNDFIEVLREKGVQVEAHTISGVTRTVVANRISFLLNLHGPSETVDTACSSSLIAMHRAITSIQNGDCDMAITGGVNLLLSPVAYVALSKNGMMSPDGRCKTFDKDANGYVRGEGAIAMLLKPLPRAEADGDHIYAVIRGSAENHGGRANSLSAPNANAQADLIVKAFQRAQISPDTVTYIEAHGTGTSLGDPIEVNGLKKAFSELFESNGQTMPKSAYCGLGSVKTNIGHLEGGAGVAGVMKVLLALQHRKLPKSINFQQLNDYIQLKDSPFYIVTETRNWEPLMDGEGGAIPRRAGVSSFGFGGSNAHVILEEYIPQISAVPNCKNPLIFPISAKNNERLREYIQTVIRFMERNQVLFDGSQAGNSLMDMAYTLQVGREAMEERLAVLAGSAGELLQKLTAISEGRTGLAGVYQGNIRGRKPSHSTVADTENSSSEILAELWTNGAGIDWQLLYMGGLPRRMSLPTYPFKKERFWVEDQARQIASAARIHPLLDQNTSNLQEIRFQTDIGVQQRCFPGTGGLPTDLPVLYLEMARAAGEIAAGQKIQKMAGIRWANSLAGVAPRILHTALYSGGHGIHCEIRDGETERVLFQGSLLFTPGGEEPEAGRIDLSWMRNGMTINPEIQGRVSEGFQELWISDEAVLAGLATPAYLREHKEILIHPVLVTKMLQAAGLFSGIPARDGKLSCLPVAMKELSLWKPLTDVAYIHVTPGNPGLGTVKDTFTVQLLNQTGELLARMEDLAVRPAVVGPAALVGMNDKEIMDFLRALESGASGIGIDGQLLEESYG